MAAHRSETPPRAGLAMSVTANTLVLAAAAYAAALNARYPDFYYLTVQEDEYLEWASFWAFLLAAAWNVAGAFHQKRSTGKLPWFLTGVGLFCFFVAMEEISWGQRILGYRPPSYFLEHNFQQELNVHNVVSTENRKLTLEAVILGYGVVLPLIGLVPFVGRRLHEWAVVPPPAGLVPAFLATFVVYERYPWTFSGEWVELMLGLGFLFSASIPLAPFRHRLPASPGRAAIASRVVVPWIAVVAMGTATAAVSRSQTRAHPANIEAARSEVEALRRDFESGHVRLRCGLHKRLYTFVLEYQQDHLLQGEFSGLVAQGLPEQRAEFLLDPWNSPYWVRSRCESGGGRRIAFVYSFGPNRRRDSTPTDILGDDVGAHIGDGAR